MKRRSKKTEYIFFIIVGALLLFGVMIGCYSMVKHAVVENEQKSLSHMVRTSAQRVEACIQAKKNLIYAAFSGDMDGEKEIQRNMIKVGGKGKMIRLAEVPGLLGWEQEACAEAGRRPGEVIEVIGKSAITMTKAVYMNGSIAGYVQMEMGLHDIYTPEEGAGYNLEYKLVSKAKSQCYLEWAYEGTKGVPIKVRKLVAVETISVGEAYLAVYLTKNYEDTVKHIERIFLWASIVMLLALVGMGTIAYNRTKKWWEEYHQSRTVGVLTGAIAHEFNNLMTPIVLYTGLLGDNAIVCDEMQEEIKELKSAADRCEELAGQLLQYMRIGREEKSLVDYNATAAVRESAQMVERLLPERIGIQTNVCEKSYYLRGQFGAISQIILNLTTNAIHSIKEEGSLTIQFGLSIADDRMVRLLVCDTGTGIAPEIRRRVFEPFFTTKKEGTGIGLTVVKRLVEEHGGHIKVESEVGVGTRFIIDIPRVSEKKEAETTVP